MQTVEFSAVTYLALSSVPATSAYKTQLSCVAISEKKNSRENIQFSQPFGKMSTKTLTKLAGNLLSQTLLPLLMTLSSSFTATALADPFLSGVVLHNGDWNFNSTIDCLPNRNIDQPAVTSLQKVLYIKRCRSCIPFSHCVHVLPYFQMYSLGRHCVKIVFERSNRGSAIGVSFLANKLNHTCACQRRRQVIFFLYSAIISAQCGWQRLSKQIRRPGPWQQAAGEVALVSGGNF